MIGHRWGQVAVAPVAINQCHPDSDLRLPHTVAILPKYVESQLHVVVQIAIAKLSECFPIQLQAPQQPPTVALSGNLLQTSPAHQSNKSSAASLYLIKLKTRGAKQVNF